MVRRCGLRLPVLRPTIPASETAPESAGFIMGRTPAREDNSKDFCGFFPEAQWKSVSRRTLSMIRKPSLLAAVFDMNYYAVGWTPPAIFSRRGQLCGINEDFGPEQDAAKGAVWRHNGGINVAMADGHVEYRKGQEIPVCSYEDPFWSYYADRY